ncbi:hypothetical protein RAD04_09035 [Bradyrhizobium sp. 25ACV]
MNLPADLLRLPGDHRVDDPSYRRRHLLLLLTFILSMPAFGTGRTNVLFGLVHMMVSGVYVFMDFVP